MDLDKLWEEDKKKRNHEIRERLNVIQKPPQNLILITVSQMLNMMTIITFSRSSDRPMRSWNRGLKRARDTTGCNTGTDDECMAAGPL